jgi:hypothetical protein
MGNICRRRLKVRLYLTGDGFADMLGDGLYNFIGNIGITRRLKPPWLVGA